MNSLTIFFIFISGIILQLTIADNMAIAGSQPDFVIIVLVSIAVRKNPIPAVIIGFLLGFLQDLANPVFLGMNALSKSLLAYAISRIGGAYLPHTLFYFALLVFSSCLINDVIVLNIVYNFSISDVLRSFFRFSLLTGIYSTAIAILLYILFVFFELVGVRNRTI